MRHLLKRLFSWSEPRKEFTEGELLFAARQRKRDELFRRYGSEWRKHERFGHFWSGIPVSQWELDAVEMNRGLIGWYPVSKYPRITRDMKLPALEALN